MRPTVRSGDAVRQRRGTQRPYPDQAGAQVVGQGNPCPATGVCASDGSSRSRPSAFALRITDRNFKPTKRQRIGVTRVDATGHAILDDWPPQEYGDFMLDQGRAVGNFRPAVAKRAELLVEARAPTPLTLSPMLVERLTLGARTISVRGFVPHGRTQAALWLDDGVRRYRASLRTLPGVATPIGDDWEFFWGTVTVPDGPRRYRIGFGLDSDIQQPLVYWTGEWLKVDS